MKKQLDQSTDAYVSRHLSQMKILTRLVEHEVVAAKGQNVTLDRELADNLLDTLEIFVEDVDYKTGGPKADRDGAKGQEGKATVTRLN